MKIQFNVLYFQGPESLPPLLVEEKVVFGLNAKATSQLTLAKIKKVYSRADNKSIAKQVMFFNCFIIPFEFL